MGHTHSGHTRFTTTGLLGCTPPKPQPSRRGHRLQKAGGGVGSPIEAVISQKQVASKPLQLAAPALPSKAQIADALGLSLSIAGWMQQLVAKAVLAEDEGWRNQRWLVSFTYSPDRSVPHVQAIDHNAMVMSLAELARSIVQPNGMLISNVELANLAAARNKRLAEHMVHLAKNPPARPL